MLRYAITLPGLPTFNADDPAFSVELFEAWGDGPAPQAILVSNGGGPGAVAVDPWLPGESYYVLNGSIEAEPALHGELRRMLMAAVTPDAETAIQVTEPSGTGLQVFVRVYDRRSIEPLGRVLTFSLPLVAPDPYKYGLTPLVAECGAFAPTDWYRVYHDDGAGDWYRTYDGEGADHYRNYEEDAGAVSALPTAAVLTSAGDADSRRLTVTVTGPLSAGDWWLEDAHGTRLWAEVGLRDGQSVVFDSRTRTATLAGANIDHLVQGNYLLLEQGVNTYRLQVGTPTGGYATFEGWEAYL